AIFLGAAPVNVPRPDVGAIFGAQFGSSGFNLGVRGLAPGPYRLIVYAHSTLTGTFPIWRIVDVTVASTAVIAVGAPANGASVSQRFLIGGWAADFAAPSGGGVDVVHVYAYPLDWSGGAIFLGQAVVSVPRPDVGA